MNSGVGVVEGAGVGIVIYRYQLVSKIAHADFYTVFIDKWAMEWQRLLEDSKVILHAYHLGKKYGKMNVGISRLRM